MKISIVIRTLNEERYLEDLMTSIKSQNIKPHEIEIVVIDSGSTDKTLHISKKYDAKITHIKKSEFTFGRSLNMGTKFSSGDIIVYISGHCIPVDNDWLINLVKPIMLNEADYTYGKQIGKHTTKFSEKMIFKKYFPDHSKIHQKDFFCNNANSAIKRSLWKKFKFDEKITGLEDMHLAKKALSKGFLLSYISDAIVYHIHDETWSQTKRRYEREALALKEIMPEMYISFADTFRYIYASIVADLKFAIKEGVFFKECIGIIRFRIAQYYGAYIGNSIQREISDLNKEKYFYPNKRI